MSDVGNFKDLRAAFEAKSEKTKDPASPSARRPSVARLNTLNVVNARLKAAEVRGLVKKVSSKTHDDEVAPAGGSPSSETADWMALPIPVPEAAGFAHSDMQAKTCPAMKLEEGGAKFEAFRSTHGPIIGEVTEGAATVWFRDSRPPPRKARSLAWWVASDSQSSADEMEVKVDRFADFTCKARLVGLKPSTCYEFRVGDDEELRGSFKTAGSRSVSFVFGSCIGGQCYGRNVPGDPNGEGFPVFEAMKAVKPDFFYLNGDSVYADDVIEAESTQFWNKGRKNVVPVGERSLRACSNLEEFRSRHKYHYEDPTYAKFLATTPVYNTWDDHEIFDDWGPHLHEAGKGQLLEDGQRAFFEFWPVCGPPEEPRRVYRKVERGPHLDVFVLDCRSYRDSHHAVGESETPQMRYILGDVQRWPRPDVDGYDGWADGKADGMSGPEKELSNVFEHVRDKSISGVIFISGDVHFPFALSYDPFDSGKPLVYEVASTPLHALCLPAPPDGPRDKTFKPSLLFSNGTFAGNLNNFGHVIISEEGHLELHLRDFKGASLFELRLAPPL